MTTDTLERTKEASAAVALRQDEELDGIITAYLYYLEYENGGTAVRSETIYEFYDRPEATVDKDKLALQLITNAYTWGDDPPPYSTNHENFLLRRKSYLIIVAANAADINANNPIEFLVTNADGDSNNGNHTFQDVEFNEVTFGSGTANRLQIITCENMMKSMEHGGNLNKKEWEDFTFTLRFEVAALVEPLAPDSGGTNMGPPVPPPVRIVR